MTVPPDVGGLIFDCDGTLADTMPAHFHAWTATLQPLGLLFPEERFYAWGGMPTATIIDRLSREQGIEVDVMKATYDKEAAFLDYIDDIRPMAAVVAIAATERGRKKIAVASGGYRDVVERTLRQIGVRDWFEVVVTAEDTPRHKPEPDVFLEAARQLGLPASACAIYEDTDIGLEAARRAGGVAIDVRPWTGRS